MSAAKNDVRTLNGQGGGMPALGFGTWKLSGQECIRSIQLALDAGYAHIDTAQGYHNEGEVGEGIREAATDRGDIFLTTKVWMDNLAAGDLKESTEQSLRKLGTDYVDLLLIHWPSDSVPMEESLGAMSELRDAGKIRHLGVSNFSTGLLDEAQRVCDSPIFCNQVEYHPYLAQEPLLDYCRQNDILMVAYSPLARGKVFDDEALQSIGEAHGKNPGQVVLRWLLQQEGVAAIPKSGNPEHIQSNRDVFDFELSDREMELIHRLACGDRLIDPDIAPEWD